MKIRCSLLRRPLTMILMVSTVVAVILYKKYDSEYWVPGKKFIRSTVSADQWIIVDGTHVSSDDLSDLDDVPNWRILVFGEHTQRPKDGRCINCVFIKDELASYLHAISQAAKWIYVTNKVSYLEEQVAGFHLDPTIKGLLYNGRMIFNPDVHFGVPGISDHQIDRSLNSFYYLGQCKTPGVQKIWTPPKNLNGSTADINSFSCRLPKAIVPPRLFQAGDLMGSLIEHRSFWALGSLLSRNRSRNMASWWLWLMRDIGETVGINPPSCWTNSTLHESWGQFERKEPETSTVSLICDSKHTFFTCAILLAEKMLAQGTLHKSDVRSLNIWFDSLNLISFPEPIRKKNKNNEYSIGPIHKVRFEAKVSHDLPRNDLENPFSPICKSKLPKQMALIPRIHDILLIVIFNFPTYYSNIAYLDYLYRKFFTNIVYCGTDWSKFSKFKRTYSSPLNFVEVPEIHKGFFGYMCLVYAMEMGFKVSGYMQMSDDVLLNMWNLNTLPRDKIWFQPIIRKASIQKDNVPTIAPNKKRKLWDPWRSKKMGVQRLRKIWIHFEKLRNSSDEWRIVQFLNQLNLSFGGFRGAFYEASDIFYLPNKYKEDFIFFSNVCLGNNLFLEIAIPTMLCGFDNISDIVRLNGSYLWFEERPTYPSVFNPEHIFLHPWKVKNLLVNVKDSDFLCTRYLPFIEVSTSTLAFTTTPSVETTDQSWNSK